MLLVLPVVTVFLVVALIGETDPDTSPATIVLVVFIGACSLALAALGLFFFTRQALERLQPKNWYRRVHSHRLSEQDPIDPGLPEGALISSPRDHGALYVRAIAFLILGAATAALAVYIPGPYANSGGREWGYKVAITAAASLAVGMGAVLMPLAVPRLVRRDLDAIDVGVKRAGVIVRGGLELEWQDIAEVLVVRDERMTEYIGRRRNRFVAEPRGAINPTYFPGHSRTRLALVLHDLPGIVARAPRSAPLYADHTNSHGYALCDLWTYPREEVDDMINAIRPTARRAHVRVTELHRVVGVQRLD
ncbi:hypothetical protein QF046_001090 [Microbacterium sp. W4I4]|uniref:hypothetical protein n=1 Tax=Microbacterium sp. W4I4 TaxID=3042295 RepID=UPI0027891D17|nr:hypothetical protein [Microbacterium sp. W4I4]MDQ0613449.1 hypothetical protein [Microbacterium sp. W4I4]